MFKYLPPDEFYPQRPVNQFPKPKTARIHLYPPTVIFPILHLKLPLQHPCREPSREGRRGWG